MEDLRKILRKFVGSFVNEPLVVMRDGAGNTYIMVPPHNTTALEGSRVKLSCQAEAFPNNVTYEWWHNDNNDDDNADNVVPAGSRTTIYADGSLVFASVDVADTGWYTCRPTNGLGLTPEARAYLNVTCKSVPQSVSQSSSHFDLLPDKFIVIRFITSSRNTVQRIKKVKLNVGKTR